MTADPVVSPADTIRRLTEWSNDAPHDGQSVRFEYPTYANPGELRRDVRALLAVGERDKAEIEPLRKALADAGLPATASVDDLIQHHRNNAALAAAFDKVAERERDRQQIARLTEAIRSCICDAEGEDAVRRGKMLTLTKGQVQLLAAALDTAVLADEEYARP